VTSVEYRRLGPSDREISVVGLGCNNFGGRVDVRGTRDVVEAALDAGVTFFDTADVYGSRGGSERFLGEILEDRREQVVIATKFGWDDGGSPDHVRSAIDRSLERLRTSYVDLYYYHRPDGVTPFVDTLGAMHELVEQRKVRDLGCSNLTADQLREVHEATRTLGIPPIVALQNQYSLLERSAAEDVLPLCRELGIGFVPYFPLASGLLTGKYRRGERAPAGSRLAGRSDRLTDETFAELEALEEFARERGRSLLELAVGALASQPGVASVIAGATTPEQVRANAVAGGWLLSEDDLGALSDVLSIA
jgi:aryl-alcohol dehydrogenase-like predicted oxidoreductase